MVIFGRSWINIGDLDDIAGGAPCFPWGSDGYPPGQQDVEDELHRDR